MKIRIILGALILLVSGQVNAALLYDNGGPSVDNGFLVSGGSISYDDFNLTEDSIITSVGFYLTNPDNLSTWDRAIDYLFRSDSGGPLGGVLASGSGQNIAAIDSGIPGCCTSAGWGNAWLVTFDLESSFAATSGVTYWLGLTGAGVFSGQEYWNTTSGEGTGNAWVQGVGYTYELAFFLEGEPSSPVPIPATLWLFGTGIIGLIGFSKRRKAA